jgi:hypothetical protein
VSALFTSAAGVSRWWGPTEGDAAAGGTLVTSFGDHGVNAMRMLEAGPTRVVRESIAPVTAWTYFMASIEAFANTGTGTPVTTP